MKILFLAHRIPFPPDKGEKIRAFHELKYLAERHTVDLFCLADISSAKCTHYPAPSSPDSAPPGLFSLAAFPVGTC